MPPLSVVILAAGQGKRMNSDLPKVLQPLAGRPLLQHVISTARALDPESIYVVYGFGGGQVQTALHEENVDWVLQSEQLGTGHAVMQAMPLIPADHTVLVLYGDVPMIQSNTLQQLLRSSHAGGSLALLTLEIADPTGYGRIIRDAAGQVTAIIEERDATPEQRKITEINTGVMAAPAGEFRNWLLDIGRNNDQKEYLLTDAVGIAVKSGRKIGAVAASGSAEVLGVNDKLQLAQVEANYRQMRARELMLAGATLADPARTDIRGTVSVGRDVFIDINAVLTGDVYLGSGVKIGPNCVITNSRIGACTEVHANSIIDNADVGENCRIGPFARLRPDAVLRDDVHIGNFVEVKNAEIGANSKANHLTYVGDATVGSGVNIGAGTITCNYDGVNKWPTVIEDGAFIGSGSMLVAPVRIGAGSNIGAGSTITAVTPDGKLSLGRARQVTINSWKRPPKFTAAEKKLIIEKALKK
jgi:bifunctional UDP-N-acetylglucosamine pyrophosphorylase / glucosamine-1-phosphate N-acetyltransferase